MKKRIISLSLAFSLFFAGIAGRCAYIAKSDYYEAGSSYNSISLDISKLFTNIYSRNGVLLNNSKKSMYAIIKPNEKSLSELDLLFSDETAKNIVSKLSDGYPVISAIEKYAKTKYITLVEVTQENSTDMLCRHLLDKEFSGLEKYTDKEIGSLSVNFSVDALGKILDGDAGTIVSDNYENDEGVKISIDEKIQKIAEEESECIDNGSVVILDTATSQILAAVSCGNDYLNRSILPYAIGSIFKLVVAAAAIENNIDPEYTCQSKIKVGDTVFNCQNKHKHGKQHIKQALANSCNCYFVNLALKLGKEKIYSCAKSLGFGDEISIYDDYICQEASFPSLDDLSSKGQLALLAFGQGKLTDTPLHFAAVLSAISNGGKYIAPTLKIEQGESKTAFSQKTADMLKEYMRYVVTDGTAVAAQYNNDTAGKTATAQSGIYENGTEKLNTWFVGLFPYSSPKYSIVVMCEGGVSGAEDCCPVFRNIVEKLDKM